MQGLSGQCYLEDRGSLTQGQSGQWGQCYLEGRGSTMQGQSGQCYLEDRGASMQGLSGQCYLEDREALMQGLTGQWGPCYRGHPTDLGPPGLLWGRQVPAHRLRPPTASRRS